MAYTVLCFVLAFSFVSAQLEGRVIRASQGSQRSAGDEVLFVANTFTVRLLTLGYNQAAADVLWLKSIQYFVDHLLTDRRYPWLEHFVDQVIALDPRFKQVYLWAGGCILYGQEIVPERVHRANRIYRLALERFPEDYEPAYRLGMNYFSELRVDDPEERERYRNMGLAYFERAAHAPNAPPNILPLIRGIAKRQGRDEVLFFALTDELLGTEDPQRKAQIQERINALVERIQSNHELKGGGTLSPNGLSDLLKEAQHRSKMREARAPYLPVIDFDLIDSPSPTQRGWRALLESLSTLD